MMAAEIGGMAFRGIWIPNTLWLDETISKLEMLILADMLIFKKYYKSNATMMRFFGISESTLKRTLASMEKKNLIKRTLIKDTKTGRTIGRILEITDEEKDKIFRYDNRLENLDYGVGCQNERGQGVKMNPYVGCQNEPWVGCQNEPQETYIKNIYENTYREERGVAEATPQTPPKKSHFQKPTVEEIQAYLDEKDIVGIDAEYFWNFYETKGWLVGKSPMKNWKACIATWVKRNEKGCKNGNDTRNDDEAEIPNLEWLYDEWKTIPKNGDGGSSDS